MVNKPFDYKTWCRKSSYHIPGCVIGHDKESPALKHFWQSWSKNILFNKERINSLPALNELYDPGWADEPCLVVAGGPSAYERMDDIGKAQAAGWRIVAVDKIYGALRAHGIRPDMTISLDSQDIVAEWFDGVPIDKTDKFGVCITSSLKTYDALDGGSVYPFAVVKSNKDFENVILQYFGRKYFSVRAGAIVTFDAVEFALWMGCDPIVTIGNELSYERIQDVPKRNSIKK
ncbi:MAG: DUF115 domain-containing protein, partial [Aestuariibacter sp.]|nr:DUF115 domain-containing protein [Aestuariibacter sp.]